MKKHITSSPRSACSSYVSTCCIELDEMQDRLLHMRKLESTVYQRTSDLVDESWREPIIEWMYAVVSFCNLSHGAVAAAAHYLDTAVGKGLLVTPQDYQLGAMSALFLALKCYDSPLNRDFQLSSFVRLGNGQFTEDDVVEMELKLVNALDWRLNPPTPNCFLEHFMQLLPQDIAAITRQTIKDVSMWILQIAVCREQFIEMKPSILTLASMLVAIERIDSLDFTRYQLHNFVFNVSYVAKLDYNSSVVTRACCKLHRTMSNIPDPQDKSGLQDYFKDLNRRRSIETGDESESQKKQCFSTSPNYVGTSSSSNTSNNNVNSVATMQYESYRYF